MISKSFKKAGDTFNLGGCEDELFIDYSKEDDVEEIVREVDQTPNDENIEPVGIEIVKEKVDNPSDENYSIILAKSDDEEEKEGTVEKDFHILKFDKKESELIKDL